MSQTGVKQQSIQQKRRVVLPKNHMDELNIGVGDDVLIACTGNKIEIRPATVDQLR